MHFRDREDAGQRLAQRVARDFSGEDAIVLALPRGGVPVAYEVARELNAPLDVLIVRKLGTPFNPELAAGAIGPHDVTVYNDDVLWQLGLDPESLEPTRKKEQDELQRRERIYRGDRPPLDVKDKTVILIDDGVATGATMTAAIEVLRRLDAGKVVVAVPTSARDTYRKLQRLADEAIALSTPEPYIAVGAWYEHFDQTTDARVIDLLAAAARSRGREAQ